MMGIEACSAVLLEIGAASVVSANAPVWLESGPATTAPATDGGAWMLVLFGIAATLVAAALVVWLYGAALDKPNAETLAFRRLARMMRVRREDRRIVERLAEAHGGATPVALLISEQAFRDAVGRAMTLEPAPSARQVADLERRLFG